MKKYIDDAIKALIYEVALSPKPGLVDAFDNGAHTDMDFFTFLDSAFSLKPYFQDYYLAGQHCHDDPIQLFSNIRFIGIEAEKAMLKATNKINTHKGANFSFGVVLAAMGANHHQNIYELPAIINTVKQMTIHLTDELGKDDGSHGQQIYREYGITGIRGEVAAGFPIVMNHALQSIEEASDLPLQNRLLKCLLIIMSENDDTNILSRGNMQELIFTKQEAKRILSLENTQLEKELRDLNQVFIRKNLSPGGSADLLALTIFFSLYLDLI